MSELVERKLKLKEVLMISKILRDMNTKSYAEYVMRQFDKNKKQLEILKKDKLKTKDDIENAKKEFESSIGIDIGIFALENIELSKESVFALIGSYNDISSKEAENMDFDDVILTFKAMFKNGLPEILFSQLKQKGADFLAKSNVLSK